MSIPVKSAIKEVREIIVNEGIPGDIEYFDYHEKRYIRMATSVSNNVPLGSKILDIGSHYLHSAMILSKMGYKMVGMDVGAFWDLSFVQQRAKNFRIEPRIQNDLQVLEGSDLGAKEYDMILFTEILEHITFNPIGFWHEIYSLLKSNGKIYISTPNSLSATGIVRALKNLMLFKGLGLPMEMIFTQVTYGHHWKEYSSREIKKYFSLLSDDFRVEIKKYSYQHFDKANIMHILWSAVRVLGNLTYIFASDLEVIVSVDKSHGHSSWKLKAPEY